MDQKKTGRFLKQLRNEKGITQEQLARKFNVSNRSVSRWETGSNLPDISLLVEIADFYDVDVREIIDGERKSEMMDKEVREVAGKMAEYAGNEKSTLLREVQVVGIIGTWVAFCALWLQIQGYEPNLFRFCGLTLSFAVLIMIGFITLYVTGILSKLVKKKKFMTVVKVITVLLLAGGCCIIYYSVMIGGLLALDILTSRIKVQTDPAGLNEYIHTDEVTGLNGEVVEIIPQTLAGLDVKEYQLTYYNPWDAQYVLYMSVEYGNDEYEAEIERLEKIGIDDYIGIYTVTGEPEGYDLVAMDSDDYSGFVYAMIPEGAGDQNREIRYVVIWFCNRFLDLDIHEYIPDDYLLPGFDATLDNPYKQQFEAEESVETLFPMP